MMRKALMGEDAPMMIINGRRALASSSASDAKAIELRHMELYEAYKGTVLSGRKLYLAVNPSAFDLRLVTAPYISRCMKVALRNAQRLPAVGGAYVEQFTWRKHASGVTRCFWVQFYNKESLEILLGVSRSEQLARLFGLPGGDVQVGSFVLERFKDSYAGAYAGVSGGSVRSSSSYGGSQADSDEAQYPNKASVNALPEEAGQPFFSEEVLNSPAMVDR